MVGHAPLMNGVMDIHVKYDTKMILYVNTIKTLAAYLTTILFRLRLAPTPVDDEGALIIYNYDVFLRR
jgi:hypothetical protein